jgi:hypothetical protein
VSNKTKANLEVKNKTQMQFNGIKKITAAAFQEYNKGKLCVSPSLYNLSVFFATLMRGIQLHGFKPSQI